MSCKATGMVPWGSAVYRSIPETSYYLSDAYTFEPTTVSAIIQFKSCYGRQTDDQLICEAGGGSSDELVRIFAIHTTGDPDAEPEVADEYAELTPSSPDQTTQKIQYLATISHLNVAVVIKTVPLGVSKAFKLWVENTSVTTGRRVTFSARVMEQLADA